MIDKTDFGNIKKELENLDRFREEAIQRSREIIRLSKQIIYALHRNDVKTAGELIKKIRLDKGLLLRHHFDSDTDMPIVALQEYVEATTYYEFITSGRIPRIKELKVPVDAYLGGLADLTGELVRKAVDNLINNRFEHAVKIKGIVDDIYGQFLRLDFRNGDLRKKADSIKWNLNKLTEVVFEAKLKMVVSNSSESSN